MADERAFDSFLADERDRKELQRRLIPVQARLGRDQAALAGKPGPQSCGAVPGADEVVAGAIERWLVNRAAQSIATVGDQHSDLRSALRVFTG